MKLKLRVSDKRNPSEGIGEVLAEITVSDNLKWTGDMTSQFVEFFMGLYDVSPGSMTLKGDPRFE